MSFVTPIYPIKVLPSVTSYTGIIPAVTDPTLAALLDYADTTYGSITQAQGDATTYTVNTDFTLGSWSGGNIPVVSLNVIARVYYDDATGGYIAGIAPRYAGTTTSSKRTTLLETAKFRQYVFNYALNPATGLAWTRADLTYPLFGVAFDFDTDGGTASAVRLARYWVEVVTAGPGLISGSTYKYGSPLGSDRGMNRESL